MGPKRGEIHWASVPKAHTEGHEQFNEAGRPRTWLILSDNRLPARAGLVIACPLTTQVGQSKVPDAFRVEVTPDMIEQTPDDQGVLEGRLLLGEQIRVMSVERLAQGHSRLGKLKDGAMVRVETALRAVLGLDRPRP